MSFVYEERSAAGHGSYYLARQHLPWFFAKLDRIELLINFPITNFITKTFHILVGNQANIALVRSIVFQKLILSLTDEDKERKEYLQ